jgi:hypothetical protein
MLSNVMIHFKGTWDKMNKAAVSGAMEYIEKKVRIRETMHIR